MKRTWKRCEGCKTQIKSASSTLCVECQDRGYTWAMNLLAQVDGLQTPPNREDEENYHSYWW